MAAVGWVAEGVKLPASGYKCAGSYFSDLSTDDDDDDRLEVVADMNRMDR